MAVTSKQVVVSTIPVQLAVPNDGWVHLTAIHHNVAHILLGGPNLTVENGFLIQLGPQPFSLQLKASDPLWARTRFMNETTLVSVLQHIKV